MLVRTGKAIITRNVTWARIPSLHPAAANSVPLVKEVGYGCRRDRVANSVDSDIESGDDNSESQGEGIDMVTSEADDTERDYPDIFGEGCTNSFKCRKQRQQRRFL